MGPLRVGPPLRLLRQAFWTRQGWNGRGRLGAALLCMVGARAATVYVPVLFKLLIDALSAGDLASAGLPLLLIVGYGFSRLATTWLNETRDILLIRATRTATRDLAVDAFEHLNRLGPGFLLGERVGALTERLGRGITGSRQVIESVLFNTVPTLFEIGLVVLVLAKVLDLRFAAVTLATVLAYVLFSITVTEWRIKFRRAMNSDYDRARALLTDNLLNFEPIAAFDNLPESSRRYRDALESFEASSLRSVMSLSLVNIGQGLIISTGLTIVLYMAAHGLAQKALTVGAFVMVSTYLLQLFQPLNTLGFTYRQVRQGLIDLGDLADLLQQRPAVADNAGGPALDVREGRISFEAVSFAYGRDAGLLEEVSFTVEPGQTVAVVGESGSGKTTLGRLLLRFYDPRAGRIRIDGQDIAAVEQASLRRAVGIVTQDTILLSDSLRYNVAFGRVGASADEVRDAATAARLDKLVARLPAGLDSEVGERGARLSAGERQRIAIARVVLKDAPILLLDEATSALDALTESEILDNLAAVARGRTTLVIAHRLATVARADRIVVLDGGRIAESGTHQELLRAGGVYARLWQRQQRHLGQDDRAHAA